MNEQETSNLEKISFKETGKNLIVKLGDTTVMFFKYKGLERLGVNLDSRLEFFTEDNEIKNIAEIFNWYLANKEKVPELIPVYNTRTEHLLLGVKPEELEIGLKTGKYEMQGKEVYVRN